MTFRSTYFVEYIPITLSYVCLLLLLSPLQWQIIPLLTQAVSHLKSYGCERMITSLKLFLADEYYLVKDYEKSFVYVLTSNLRTEIFLIQLTSVGLCSAIFKLNRQ